MILPVVYFLKEDEQLLIESFTRRFAVNGPRIWTKPPLFRVTRRKGITLGPLDYLRLRDTLTGKLRNEIGPKLYFLAPSEEVVEKLAAITLQNNQFVAIVDRSTGVIRVERGENTVYLSPTEELIGTVRQGFDIDEDTAVLIRDVESGQLSLITEPQVFIPAPDQNIVEIRKSTRLADHEAVVIKEKSGKFTVRKGSESSGAFFLQPYTEFVEMYWSAGIHKDKRSLRLRVIDLRPKFMWYEFEARTQDNVELIIGITFFWQISAIDTMIANTDDPTGDICSHARSVIIQAVSQVSLERFLAEFNTIVNGAVLQPADTFYQDRGALINAIEVRSIACKEEATQRILQEIIQETTNRLNRLQKQESENEIKLKQIQGDTEAETARSELLEVQSAHVRAEALIQGQAEAEKVKAFLDGLGGDVNLAEKIDLFNMLRKRDILQALGEGSAQLYFTPSDVNLSIESKQN